MNQKDSGWLFTHRHMAGPSVYEKVEQPRINALPADAGDPTNARIYVLGDSLNVGSYSSFEVNKTFRMEPYRYGGILEPLVGLRYSSFKDYSLNQSYLTTTFQPSTGGNATTFLTEILTTGEWTIRNEMFGGQLGFRYFNHVGRWTLSTELRALGLANFRREQQHLRSRTTEYAGVAGNSAIVTDSTTFPALIKPKQTTSFVPGFEIRAEAAYKLTKYIDFRSGVDFVNLASNIRRGTVNQGPQLGLAGNNSVQMTGFTFGIAINR